jgi:hypothetical protein
VEVTAGLLEDECGLTLKSFFQGLRSRGRETTE